MNEERPNPDLLLTRIVSENSRKRRGHFRLFFGMAAGVGKTYAMLKNAHERVKEGVDVHVGVIETHGRPDTVNILSGLKIIPRKKIQYRDTEQEEMDIDAILTLRPQLVLIDELAHSNVPGSRHEKRYQDVIEILEAGIDVYSTMNVQHLESRVDVVGLITAVTVRETVPDSVLDFADQIEVIDITPHELIERLKEGKIYPGRKTEQALEYFFQPGNLSALREIALRVTADKVERDMREFRPSDLSSFSISKNTGKLLVAIGYSPFSEKLIRMARRIVEDLEMPWVAVHVDTGRVLSTQDQNQLVSNLDLAKEMGAETVTLHGADIADTISDYIASQKIVQMIVGRPSLPAKWWMRPSRLIEKLIKNNPQIDITVIQQPIEKPHSDGAGRMRTKWRWQSFFVALFWVLLCAVLSKLVDPLIGYRAVGFVFLLLVLILSVFLPFAAVFWGASLSALIWNYFFIPPEGTFSIKAPEDVMMFFTYFVIACVGGFLTFQTKRNQTILKEREGKTRALYEILKSMTLVQGTTALVELALEKIKEIFHAECAVLLVKNGDLALKPDFGKLEISENDRAVAVWSFGHGRMAGWSTDTLPLARVLCLALKSGENKYGVLVFCPDVDKKLNPDQVNLLISIANQIGVVLAKQSYDEENRSASLLKESEKLHQTLLNCVSHELRTPLTAIMGAATALQTEIVRSDVTASCRELAQEIVSSSERLNHIFENLLDVTRIEAGAIKLKQEWFDMAELVQFSIERQAKLLAHHEISFVPPEMGHYFFGDYELLSHALSNVLVNAANYSPLKSRITIKIRKYEHQLFVEISDEGPGISAVERVHIFDKFYRLPGTPTGGLGLGLSITKNLIELHGGKIDIRNNETCGATLALIFPYVDPPKQIQELV